MEFFKVFFGLWCEQVFDCAAVNTNHANFSGVWQQFFKLSFLPLEAFDKSTDDFLRVQQPRVFKKLEINLLVFPVGIEVGSIALEENVNVGERGRK